MLVADGCKTAEADKKAGWQVVKIQFTTPAQAGVTSR
jgi:hypothetical protein